MPNSLRPVLEAASEPMLIVDRSGTILLINQYAADFFGCSPSEICGQIVELLVPERLRLLHIGHRLQFTDALQMRPMGTGRQLFVRCKNGTERMVDISLMSVPRGLQTFVIVVVRPASGTLGVDQSVVDPVTRSISVPG